MSYEKTILIVDDEAAICRLLSLLLKSEGYQTRTALSGERALQSIDEKMPHLIILDLMMPGIDGFEVLRRIRANTEINPQPKVLIYTAMGDMGDKAAKAGADGYLVKGDGDVDALIARVALSLK